MKIVWLGIDYKNLSGTFFRHYYNSLVENVSSIVDVSYYGTGTWKKEDDVEKITKIENPDIIFIRGGQNDGPNGKGWINLDKVQVPKILHCSDPWANYLGHIDFIHKNNINICLLEFYEAVQYYREHTTNGCKVIPFPFAADIKYFRDLGLKRIYDVWMTGAINMGTHPLRVKISNELPKYPNIKSYIHCGHIPFSEYPKLINISKIAIFDNVIGTIDGITMKWTVERWHEAMASKTLCLTDKPNGAEQFHFIPDYNFVEINEGNFLEKIEYYLLNEDERNRIINNAYETVTKYNTIDIRMEQLMKIMETLIK